jgi:NADH pyrophosphatase NudC (nudix superfamily)
MKLKLSQNEIDAERKVAEFEEMQKILAENNHNLYNLCKSIITYKKTIRILGGCIIELSDKLKEHGVSNQA